MNLLIETELVSGESCTLLYSEKGVTLGELYGKFILPLWHGNLTWTHCSDRHSLHVILSWKIINLFYSFNQPTPCHYFIRMLAEKGILLRHFTQVSTVIYHCYLPLLLNLKSCVSFLGLWYVFKIIMYIWCQVLAFCEMDNGLEYLPWQTRIDCIGQKRGFHIHMYMYM